jgi:hypothetical protein
LVQAPVAGSKAWTTTARPASFASTVPRKRTFLPSRAPPPPESRNGAGAAAGAWAPPDGSCASALGEITANAAISTAKRIVRVLIAFSGAYEVS